MAHSLSVDASQFPVESVSVFQWLPGICNVVYVNQRHALLHRTTGTVSMRHSLWLAIVLLVLQCSKTL